MLLDHVNNCDKKITNYVVQAGEATRGPQVKIKTKITLTVLVKITFKT